MAPVMLGRGSAARVGLLIYAIVLVGVISGAHATQWTVGDTDHWAYVHADDSLNFYQNWATNKTFSTGDSLRTSLTFLVTHLLLSSRARSSNSFLSVGKQQKFWAPVFTLVLCTRRAQFLEREVAHLA